MKKVKALAGIVAAVLLVSGISVFAAQQEEEKKPSPRQKIELTEEQKAEMKANMQEKAKEMLAKKLAEGKITEEQYNEQLKKIESGEFEFGKGMKRGARQPMKNGETENTQAKKAERKELTEEEKAARKAKMQEMLAKKLEEGKITQEQYDEQLAKIESGDFRFGNGRGNGFGKGRGHSPGQGGKQADTADSNSETVSE